MDPSPSITLDPPASVTIGDIAIVVVIAPADERQTVVADPPGAVDVTRPDDRVEIVSPPAPPTLPPARPPLFYVASTQKLPGLGNIIGRQAAFLSAAAAAATGAQAKAAGCQGVYFDQRNAIGGPLITRLDRLAASIPAGLRVIHVESKIVDEGGAASLATSGTDPYEMMRAERRRTPIPLRCDPALLLYTFQGQPIGEWEANAAERALLRADAYPGRVHWLFISVRYLSLAGTLGDDSPAVPMPAWVRMLRRAQVLARLLAGRVVVYDESTVPWTDPSKAAYREALIAAAADPL